MKTKTVKNPKVLKKYRNKRKVPPHMAEVLIRTYENPFCNFFCYYDHDKGLFCHIDRPERWKIKDVKYWYIDLAGLIIH